MAFARRVATIVGPQGIPGVPGAPGAPGSPGGMTGVTGDGIASGTGVVPLVLATVNTSPGTVGSSTQVPVLTVDGKGRVTAVSSAPVIANATPVFFAALATRAPVSSQDQVTVAGYAATTDGGGGVFAWSPTSTATPDGGTIVAVTGISTGRWIRQFEGGMKPQWFGAQLTPTDSHAAFVLCDAAAHTGGTYIYADNDFTLSSELQLTCTGIRGSGWKYTGAGTGYGSTSWPTSVSGAVLRFSTSSNGVGSHANPNYQFVEQIAIIGPGTGTGYGLYQLSSVLGKWSVTNVLLGNWYHGYDPQNNELECFVNLTCAGCVYGVSMGFGGSDPTTETFISTKLILCTFPLTMQAGDVINFHDALLEQCATGITIGGLAAEVTVGGRIYQELTGSAQFNSSTIRSKVVAQGQTACPSTFNGRVYYASTGGTTGVSEPSWNVGYGTTSNDGTVVWTDIGEGGGTGGSNISTSGTAVIFDTRTQAVSRVRIENHHTSEPNYLTFLGSNGANGVVFDNCAISAMTVPNNMMGLAIACTHSSGTITNNSTTFQILDSGNGNDSRSFMFPFTTGGIRQFEGAFAGKQFGNGPFNWPYGGLGSTTSPLGGPYVQAALGDITWLSPASGAPGWYRCTTAGPTAVPWSFVAGGAQPLGVCCIDSNGNLQQITTAGTPTAFSPTAVNFGQPALATTIGATATDNTAVWTCRGPSAVWSPTGSAGPLGGDPNTSGGLPLQLQPATVPLGTGGGTITVNPQQRASADLLLTGTVPGGGTTLDLGAGFTNGIRGFWLVRYPAVTFTGTLTLKSGSGTIALVPTAGKGTLVWADGANGIGYA